MEGWTNLYFALVWLDRGQRNYDGDFARKLTALQERFPFGARWDVNPNHFIHVDFQSTDPRMVALVEKRVTGHMRRMSARSVIRFLGVFRTQEEAEAAVAQQALLQ